MIVKICFHFELFTYSSVHYFDNFGTAKYSYCFFVKAEQSGIHCRVSTRFVYYITFNMALINRNYSVMLAMHNNGATRKAE